MDTKQRHKIIPEAYLVLKNGNKVLLQRRANSGYLDGMFGLVSGHVEAKEFFSEAMVREAAEEAGIIIQPQHLVIAHVLNRKQIQTQSERVGTFFLCTEWRGTPSICEPHKCTELMWADIDQLPADTIPYIHKVLSHIKTGIFYSEAVE